MGKINSMALVLLSGGQDSTTCLFWAKKKFGRVEAVSFDYGQRHRIELKSAAKIALLAGVKHTVINVKEFEAIKNSALTDKKIKLGGKDRINKDLPSTFVPGRNILFLTIAASLAYTKKIHNLVIGVSQVDYSGYPDCRQGFMKSMRKSLSLGMEYPVKIHTPPDTQNKKTDRATGKKARASEIHEIHPYMLSGDEKTLRHMPGVRLREKGFREAGIKDGLLF